MEGALSERLKHEFHITVDGTADMAGLVRDDAAKAALGTLWRQYLGVAETYALPFLATTPTRRCDRIRAAKAGLADGDGNSTILIENMDMLRDIRDEADRRGVTMFAGGLMGCRGDAYTGEGCLSAEEALRLHRWQAGLFAEAGADFLYAALMPTLPESLGMAQAMAETGLPFFLSFTIRADGRLVDGTSLHEAIQRLLPPALLHGELRASGRGRKGALLPHERYGSGTKPLSRTSGQRRQPVLSGAGALHRYAVLLPGGACRRHAPPAKPLRTAPFRRLLRHHGQTHGGHGGSAAEKGAAINA